jgi:hypothetical protein
MLMVMVLQSLSIALPLGRLVSVAPVGLVRSATGCAPAEKSCLVGNGLGIDKSPIVAPFWGIIVLVITTVSYLGSKKALKTKAAMGAKHGARAAD